MTALYALEYDREPKPVAGDVAVLPATSSHTNADGVIVLTSSAFRLLEARRTDRGMRGPFRSAEAAAAAVGYSPSMR